MLELVGHALITKQFGPDSLDQTVESQNPGKLGKLRKPRSNYQVGIQTNRIRTDWNLEGSLRPSEQSDPPCGGGGGWREPLSLIPVC